MKVELKNIRKSYDTANGKKEVIKGSSFLFPDHTVSIIQGPSGCGKTTLLKILALLLKPDSGNYYFCGKEINFHSQKELAWYRNQKIGYIMQDYLLISGMTVYENIMLPMLISKKNVYSQIEQIIKYLELQKILEKKPEKISGGERQRTAIARAMAMQPELLLADEPTSALDAENAEKISELFLDIAQRFGTTIVIATHDHRIVTKDTQVFQLIE